MWFCTIKNRDGLVDWQTWERKHMKKGEVWVAPHRGKSISSRISAVQYNLTTFNLHTCLDHQDSGGNYTMLARHNV